MNTLMIGLIAGTLAATAVAQTGTVSTATVGDHGTPAMHAAETKKNVEASKASPRLPADVRTRQQVVQDQTVAGTDSRASAASSARGVAAAKSNAGSPKALPTKADKQSAVAGTTTETARKEGSQ